MTPRLFVRPAAHADLGEATHLEALMSRRWRAIAASIATFGVVMMLGVIFVFRPVAASDTPSAPWPPLLAIAVYLALSVALLDWSARRMRSAYAAAFVIAAAQSIFIIDLVARGERGVMTAAAGIAILAISWASVALVHSRLTRTHNERMADG